MYARATKWFLVGRKSGDMKKQRWLLLDGQLLFKPAGGGSGCAQQLLAGKEFARHAVLPALRSVTLDGNNKLLSGQIWSGSQHTTNGALQIFSANSIAVGGEQRQLTGGIIRVRLPSSLLGRLRADKAAAAKSAQNYGFLNTPAATALIAT